ncbi:MAG TPA: ATP synthase F1 subunit gamma [Cyanobacteria bacterium UBA8530]|nr:ATP synthase F1 subunit gamma [Cyanobacteria bacterium UBA8530]
MPNIREIRSRVRSIKSTEQITKAMEMVAAAKVRRAQERVLAVRPYAEKLQGIFRELVGNLPPDYESPLLVERPVRKVGLVVMSSDKGLAGSYHVNIVRLALARAAEWERRGVEVGFFAVGSKGIQLLKRSGPSLFAAYQGFGAIPSAAEARGLAADLVDKFEKGEVDRIEILYTRFHSLVRYQPTVADFLPASIIEEGEARKEESGQHLFEPSAGFVFDRLVPKQLETEIYRSLLESAASEQAARMTAMGSASKNAKEMIRTLSILYNKARQASITREILEVVGGAEALKG